MKQTIRLTESELRRMISESVKRVLKETIQGGSSAPSPEYDPYTGEVLSSRGGALGHNALDDLEAKRVAEKNSEVRRQLDSQEYYKRWCYQHYDEVMSMCPGYMNGGEYEKAYRYCN